MKQQFPHLAGFQSRGYAEDFARRHSAFGVVCIVTFGDLEQGVLAAFSHERAISLTCPCIGDCIEAQAVTR
jgi:hypothetical protein